MLQAKVRRTLKEFAGVALKSVKGKTCVFCNVGTSGGNGEHVWPDWLLRHFFPTSENVAENYEFFKNDEPIFWVENRPVTRSKMHEPHLPCCPKCNSILAGRFEDPVIKIGRESVKIEGSFSATEAETLGYWWLKTLLLHVHPEATELPAGQNVIGGSVLGWGTPSRDLYSWMKDNALPPEGLRVLAFRMDDSEQHDPEIFPLPITSSNGVTQASLIAEMRFLNLGLILLYHPGWDLEPAALLDGRIFSLWPASGPLDADSFPRSPRSPVVFRKYEVTIDGTFNSQAPIKVSELSELWPTPKFTSVISVRSGPGESIQDLQNFIADKR